MVAAACFVPPDVNILGIQDSKKVISDYENSWRFATFQPTKLGLRVRVDGVAVGRVLVCCCLASCRFVVSLAACVAFIKVLLSLLS